MTDAIDWSGCSITERNVREMGGVSTVRDVCLSADSVVENFEEGMTVDEIASELPVSADDLRAIVAYARKTGQLVRPL